MVTVALWYLQVGAERYNLFTGCPQARTATIVLRGGSEQVGHAGRELVFGCMHAHALRSAFGLGGQRHVLLLAVVASMPPVQSIKESSVAYTTVTLL